MRRDNKGKKYNVKPTTRQKKAFDNMLENGSNKGKALVDAGYSKNTAIAPTKVTESAGWIQLMEEHLADEKLAKVHNEGLEATRKSGKEEVPDYAIRHKYLDTAYKIKNKFPKEKETSIQINMAQILDKYGK